MKTTIHHYSFLLLLVMACAKWGNAQDCEEPTGSATLDINNVNALINVGQMIWSDPDVYEPRYEVPAGSGVSSMYAGNFWMGGLTPDQQLRLAGGRFGSEGTDFYPGPLSLKGLQAQSCEEFDQVWKLYRIQSLMHVAHFDCLNNPECTPDPNYQTPEVFYTYPVYGNPDNGEVYQLAPFLDYDGDGVY
ncbi:MAG: hypothetical protein KDC12_14850, partial [Flavobacteriales bacterium]|nr:hypothetical protein [Flavobacteriales bacterium]